MTTYSHSRLETFENCPLKYRFQYVDKIKRYEKGIEAFMGSVFHDCMEKLYRDLKCKVCTLEELIAFYEKQWDKGYTENIKITREDRTAGDYRSLGRKCVQDYFRRYHPFDQGRVLGLEKSITFDLDDDGRYRITGFIDRIVQADDETYEIHDYKTGGTLPEQKKLDADRQLALYQLGLEQMWDDVRKVQLVWHYAAFDKELSSRRTRKQLDALRKATIALIDTVEAAEEFQPRESALCDWCAYQDLCPERKHLFAVAELPANKYMEDDGVQLVNAFARLNTEKKKLDCQVMAIKDEMDDMKQAAIAYAKREGVQVIAGSGNKITVREKEKVSCPGKGTPQRAELEKLVHKTGQWDKVSTLDTHAFGKALMAGKLDKGLASRASALVTTKKALEVSLSITQVREE